MNVSTIRTDVDELDGVTGSEDTTVDANDADVRAAVLIGQRKIVFLEKENRSSTKKRFLIDISGEVLRRRGLRVRVGRVTWNTK
jgi:hypothetical protein